LSEVSVALRSRSLPSMVSMSSIAAI
jgi:hypothetical protein